MEKACTKCGKIKPLGDYHLDSSRRDGHAGQCKVCKCLTVRASKRRHAERARESRRRYREANRERLSLESAKWRQNNLARSREINAASSRRRHARLKSDVGYVLRNRVAAHMRFCLKGEKGGRSWESLVGYTQKQLRRHLKRTMPEGYTWDDFLSGDLHIDHIVPVAAFNITSAECFDFKRCWDLKNLRLLPAAQNLRKSDILLAPVQTSLPGV